MTNRVQSLEKCSFCGKDKDQVKKLVFGNNVYICNECIDLCNEIIEAELGFDDYEGNKLLDTIPTPRQIKEFLDQYVIGQEDAKITLSVAVYNHYKRINSLSKKTKNDVEIQKSNILLVGTTGVGKTELARTIAKMFKLPFAIADATTLTEAGYVGDDVENVLLKLIQAADYDVPLAEKGIIYIDEIDKVSRKSENVSITRDVNGEGVQHALLKILEGTVARVPAEGGRKHPQGNCIEINTSNILFICGGAFDGIENILAKKNNVGQSIGFGAIAKPKLTSDSLLNSIEPHDLIKYGLVPELVGRLPVIATLQSLDKNALLKILTEPKNAIIKQYQKLFEMDKVKVEFEDEALEVIVDKAIERKTGARGLRGILEGVMKNIMFQIPDIKGAKKVVITKDVVLGTKFPLVYDAKNNKIA